MLLFENERRPKFCKQKLEGNGYKPSRKQLFRAAFKQMSSVLPLVSVCLSSASELNLQIVSHFWQACVLFCFLSSSDTFL